MNVIRCGIFASVLHLPLAATGVDTCNLVFSERACDLPSCQIVTVCSQHPHATLDQGNALERPAINKPFVCRSAVLLSPSFRPMSAGYLSYSAGPPSFCGKGKTAGKELEEAWQPLMILPTYGPTKTAPLTSD